MRNILVVLCLVVFSACSSNSNSSTTTANASDAPANAVAVASPIADPSGGDLYYGSHLPPGPVRLTLQPPEVDRRDLQR